MNVFTVHAFQSRLVVVAYAFLVLIISNTYLANLAAFLTVDKLTTQIDSVQDLWGKAVATFPPYARGLEEHYQLTADTADGAHSATLLASVLRLTENSCASAPSATTGQRQVALATALMLLELSMACRVELCKVDCKVAGW